MTNAVILGSILRRRRWALERFPKLERVARFIDAARWLFSRDRQAAFKRWFDRPCERCGGPRNYRVWGHFQVVCFHCASPGRRITRDVLERDAAERKN